MNFQNLTNVETADTYLDFAFRGASEKAAAVKGTKQKDRVAKARNMELARVKTVTGRLSKYLDKILESFPSIDSLPMFYNQLVKTMIDYIALKKSLGSLKWAVSRINRFGSSYEGKIIAAREIDDMNKHRREFYGRVSSVLKQINQQLLFLEAARRTMKGFPTIKTSLKTICIFGFPNVGKTTLLYKLTGSKPEIRNYAFTTKNINVSYAEMSISGKKEKFQFVDTPGTLNRFNKMNPIERQADLVLRHVSDVVVYIFDLTESYPLAEQEKLYEKIKDELKSADSQSSSLISSQAQIKDNKKEKTEEEKAEKKIIVYLSKTDLVEDKEKKEKIKEFSKKYNAKKDVNGLKKDLEKLFNPRPALLSA